MALAQAGLDGREDVRPDDVRRASRTLNRQLLDTWPAGSRPRARGTIW